MMPKAGLGRTDQITADGSEADLISGLGTTAEDDASVSVNAEAFRWRRDNATRLSESERCVIICATRYWNTF